MPQQRVCGESCLPQPGLRLQPGSHPHGHHRSGLTAIRSIPTTIRSALIAAIRFALTAIHSGLAAIRFALIVIHSALTAIRSGLIAIRSGLIAPPLWGCGTPPLLPLYGEIIPRPLQEGFSEPILCGIQVFLVQAIYPLVPVLVPALVPALVPVIYSRIKITGRGAYIRGSCFFKPLLRERPYLNLSL